jgi:AAA+ superfamily predicted ATPase/ankyrin repeat protein
LVPWLYSLSNERTIRYVNQGRNILHDVSEGNDARLEYVLKNFSHDELLHFANTTDNEGKVPMDIAARRGNWGACAMLIAITKKIKCVNIYSLVVYLIQHKESELLEQLFQRGASFDEYHATQIFKEALHSKDWQKVNIIQEQGRVDLARISKQDQIQMLCSALNEDNPLAERIIQNLVVRVAPEVQAKIFEHLLAKDSDISALFKTAVTSLEVNSCAADGGTPLYYSLQKSHLPAFKLLLRSVDINTKIKSHSILYHAISMHKLDFAFELVHSKATIEQEEIDLAVHHTCNVDEDCKLRLLIRNNALLNGYTLLTKAIQDNDINQLKKLLSEYAWPNYPNNDSSYPVHWLAESTSDFFSKALSLLVTDYGMDINMKNASSSTLLHLIAHDDEKVRKLLKYNPACSTNAYNQTPWDTPNAAGILRPFFDENYFMECIDKKDTAALQKYLPDIVSYGKLKDRLHLLLHLACKCQLKEIVELLLSFGAKADREDEEGTKPKQHCLNNKEICELLESHTLDSDGYTSIQRQFLKDHSVCNIVSPNIRESSAAIKDKDGRTLMHYVAMKYCSCFKSLLDKKVNVNAVDNDGQTPLHLAITHKVPDSIKALIAAGANKNIPNNNGKTPLHIAVEEGYMEGFNNVISSENIYIRDQTGRIPIAYAIELKRNEMWPRLSPKDDKDVKFSDMLGLTEAKEHLNTVLEIYKEPVKSRLFGVTLPRAILFSGPPGVGKTMLARAFSNELSSTEIKGESATFGLNAPTKPRKFNFQVVPVSQFNHRHPGVGEEELKKVFKEAYEKAPTILFFDEIDSLGGIDRGNTTGEVSIENKKVLNTLLAEMDGFNKKPEEVIIIGATNYVHTLDKAFKDRFQVIISFELPSTQERVQLFNQFFDKVPLLQVSTNFVNDLAIKTNEFSIRQLRTLVENGCRFAFIRKHEVVTESVFTEAYKSLLAQHDEQNRKRKRGEEEATTHKVQKLVVHGNVYQNN